MASINHFKMSLAACTIVQSDCLLRDSMAQCDSSNEAALVRSLNSSARRAVLLLEGLVSSDHRSSSAGSRG